MKIVSVPGSKSITNRALILAALSDKPVTLFNVLDSDDARYMQTALQALGVKMKSVGPNTLEVTPATQLQGHDQTLFIGNAGTAARFLGALSLVVEGAFTLDGVERMQQRPQADLMSALRDLGVNIECQQSADFLPAQFMAPATLGHKVALSGKVSSQFLSGLMLVAPALKQGLEIQITDEIPSRPYIDMTIALLKKWGVAVKESEDGLNFHIKSGFNAPNQYHIPSDMSSASYPLAWSVLRQTPICIENFGQETLQGDEKFLEVIKATGATINRNGDKLELRPPNELQPIGDWDWSAMPDVSMTGMVLAAFCPGTSTFTGLESLRVKECDRILAMAQLAHFGIKITVNNDVVTIEGTQISKIREQALGLVGSQSAAKSALAGGPLGETSFPQIRSYDDHRIAMCFALVKAAIDLGADPHQQTLIKILEPECVGKTWPGFWFRLADWENQFRAVAALVLKQGDKYLIVKKPRKSHAWQFPQGGVDPGENHRQAAVRELQEECGASLQVKLKGERPLGDYAYFFPADFARHEPRVVGAKVVFYAADYLSGEVEVDNQEIIDFAWVRLDQLQDYFDENYWRVISNFVI